MNPSNSSLRSLQGRLHAPHTRQRRFYSCVLEVDDRCHDPLRQVCRRLLDLQRSHTSQTSCFGLDLVPTGAGSAHCTSRRRHRSTCGSAAKGTQSQGACRCSRNYCPLGSKIGSFQSVGRNMSSQNGCSSRPRYLTSRRTPMSTCCCAAGYLPPGRFL